MIFISLTSQLPSISRSISISLSISTISSIISLVSLQSYLQSSLLVTIYSSLILIITSLSSTIVILTLTIIPLFFSFKGLGYFVNIDITLAFINSISSNPAGLIVKKCLDNILGQKYTRVRSNRQEKPSPIIALYSFINYIIIGNISLQTSLLTYRNMLLIATITYYTRETLRKSIVELAILQYTKI